VIGQIERAGRGKLLLRVYSGIAAYGERAFESTL
jgi:hypothetical protein